MFLRYSLTTLLFGMLSCAVSVNDYEQNGKFETYIKVNTRSGDTSNPFNFSITITPKTYLQDVSQATISEYQWDFDCDGNYESTSVEPEITYKYLEEGIYEPCVKAIGTIKEAENKTSNFEVTVNKYFDFSKIYVTKKIKDIEIENFIENLRAGITADGFLKITCIDENGEGIPYAGLSFIGESGTSFYEDINGQLIEVSNTNMDENGTKEIYVSGKTSLLNEDGSLNTTNIVKLISNSDNKVEEELDINVRGGLVSSIEEKTLGGEFQHIPYQSEAERASEIDNFGTVELILKDIYGNPVSNEEVSIILLGADNEIFNRGWKVTCESCESSESAIVKSNEAGIINFQIITDEDNSVGKAKIEVSFNEIIFSFEVSIGIYNGEPNLIFKDDSNEISSLVLDTETTIKTITIENTGSASAELSQFSELDSPFSYIYEQSSCLTLSSLAPNTTCELTINLNAELIGASSSDVYINYRKYNDSISKLSRLRLTGSSQ